MLLINNLNIDKKIKKTAIFILLFFLFNHFLSSAESRGNLKSYNTSNPLSMCYSSPFVADFGIDIDTQVTSASKSQFSQGMLTLAIASRYFGLSANFDSYFSSKHDRGVGTYSHKFSVDFTAGFQKSGISIAGKWRLGGIREKEVPYSNEFSFFKLLECSLAHHNDNYIIKNLSSFSLSFGYDNFKHFSFVIFADDLLSFNSTSIDLNSNEALDGLGFSFMLNTDKYNRDNIINRFEFAFLSDFEKMFSPNDVSISPEFCVRLNLVRKYSILLSNRLEFRNLNDAELFLKNSLHITKMKFEILEYNISLSLIIPFETYTPNGDAIFRIALSFHTLYS